MLRSAFRALASDGRLLGAALFLAVAGCGFQPQFGVDPGSSRPADMNSRNVRLEVFCRACTIGYAVGSDSGEAEGEGSWQRTFNVNPRIVRTVSISVNPKTPQDWIQRVTIRVDGVVVAEDDGTTDGRYQPVNLSAAVY